MADAIDTLTEQAFSAKERGDTVTADRAFAERDQVATEQVERERAEQESEDSERARAVAEGEPAEEFDRRTFDFSQWASGDDCEAVADNLGIVPEGRAVAERFGGLGSPEFTRTVATVKQVAEQLEAANPKLAAAVERFVSQDPTSYVTIFELAAALGGSRARASSSAQGRRQMRDQSDLAPSQQGSIQDQIDALIEQHPVGTDSYKSRKVQDRLQQLYRALGDRPIVGRAGRTA